MKTIEIRVRPVTRYIITRYEFEDRPDGRNSGGSVGLGEFDNWNNADLVAKALAAAECGTVALQLSSDLVPQRVNGGEHQLLNPEAL